SSKDYPVCSFRLAVGLAMLYRGEVLLDVVLLEQLAHPFICELGHIVGDYSLGYPETSEGVSFNEFDDVDPYDA
ncbi:hypothetical protein A2U01_0020968, partial [Trifolium medium]|nr:hypothetical protein [Trifolium medium]